MNLLLALNHLIKNFTCFALFISADVSHVTALEQTFVLKICNMCEIVLMINI